METKKQYELSQVLNAKKIADSMAFKTGTALVQLLVVLFISIMFAQVSVGFGNLNAFTSGSYWANAAILFAEQYYVYYIFYDWLFTALSKSDERLVGEEGLINTNEKLLQAFKSNDDKLEKGLDQWNLEQKIRTYQDNVKEHITKLQNKLEKARLKNKQKKIAIYKERIDNAKSLYIDKETLDNIEFVNVKNYKSMTYKDLVSNGLYNDVQKGHNTLIDMKDIKRRRFYSKGFSRVLFTLMAGLLIFNSIIGGSGFWQRLSVMLFAMMIQIVMAVKDSYHDNNVNIINYSIKRKALVFCANYKPKEVNREETITDNNADVNDNVSKLQLT